MGAPTCQPRAMDRRLMDAGAAFLRGVGPLVAYARKERDEDAELQPEAQYPTPIIVTVAEDLGRAAKGTPIRSMRLGFQVRANVAQGGEKDTVARIGGALEHALDTANLQTALSTQEIVVMLATRVPGIEFRRHDLLRVWTVWLDVRAVARERTTGG